jgi:hypothetical protein
MRIARKSAIALVTVAVLGAAATLSAQNNGNPSILAVVQALQSTVNSLVTTISGINTTVNTIAASTGEGSVLFTPSVFAVGPDTLICSVTNVSDSAKNVTIQLLNANGGAVLVPNTVTLGALSTSTVAVTAQASGLRGICKITVNNGGVKSDVRGALAMYATATSSDKDIVAAF